MKRLALVIYLVWIRIASSEDGCPKDFETKQCSCFSKTKPSNLIEDAPPIAKSKSNSYYIHLKCYEATPSELNKVISLFDHKTIDKFELSNMKPESTRTSLVNLPEKWLANVRISQFKIENSILSGDFTWKNFPFENQNSTLVWFSANNCSISGILSYDTVATFNTKWLEKLPLQGIDLSKNRIISLNWDAFRYSTANLTTINLSHNSIRYIHDSAFQQVPNLKHLNLSHNELKHITRKIFRFNMSSLQSLDLSNNVLSWIPENMFVNMSSLRTVKFRNNFLSIFSELPWSQVWRKLDLLDVEENFFPCDCKLQWVVDMLHPKEGYPGRPRESYGHCTRTEKKFYSRNYHLSLLNSEILKCPQKEATTISPN